MTGEVVLPACLRSIPVQTLVLILSIFGWIFPPRAVTLWQLIDTCSSSADGKLMDGCLFVARHKQSSSVRLTRTLLHLQVSDILLHSDVALLKLKDKARISERSLPVCLPSPPGGGEPTTTTPPLAFTTRWVFEARRGDAPSSQTRLVRVGDVSQCGGERARGGAGEAVISGNPLCVIGEPALLQRASAALGSGITVAPAASGVLSAGGAPEASVTLGSSSAWRLPAWRWSRRRREGTGRRESATLETGLRRT